MTWMSTLRGSMRLAAATPGMLAGRKSADQLLDLRSQKRPDALAIAYLDDRYTWQDLRAQSDRLARFLAAEGVGAGDRVALMIDNRPEFLFVFHALQRLGAVAALINTNLSGRNLAHVVQVASPAKLVFGSEHAGHLAALREHLPELDWARDVFVQRESPEDGLAGARCLATESADVSAAPMPPLPFEGNDHCAYIYTSGTTGLPKAAVISHQRMVAPGHLGGHLLHRVSVGDVIYIPLPLYHSNALLLGWGSALATGAGVALRRRFSASEFFADIRRYEAVSFVYIGELCRYLLQSPVQPGETDHSIRACTGNGLRPDIWEEFQARFGIPVVREIYGATEGTATLANLAGVPGMVGRLSPDAFLARCDLATGEPIRNAKGLCEPAKNGETGLLLGGISRLVRFDGYLDKKASDSKILRDVKKPGDAFFNTGDLLKRHPGRRLSFVDRVGDTFRWKGENVSTNEVAEILNSGKGVIESNVYGVEISGCEGRAGMATLRVEPGFDPNELARFVGEQLPSYQRPLFLRLVEGEIEVTGTFKHQKVKAREERFDPERVDEPLFYLAGDRYEPIDPAAFRAIESGEIRPG